MCVLEASNSSSHAVTVVRAAATAVASRVVYRLLRRPQRSVRPGVRQHYHVSPEGVDRPPGTSAAPFRTIGRATATAQSGDTILVASGTYPETVIVPATKRDITLRGVGPTRPDHRRRRARRLRFPDPGERPHDRELRGHGQTEAGVIAGGSDVRVGGQPRPSHRLAGHRRTAPASAWSRVNGRRGRGQPGSTRSGRAANRSASGSCRPGARRPATPSTSSARRASATGRASTTRSPATASSSTGPASRSTPRPAVASSTTTPTTTCRESSPSTSPTARCSTTGTRPARGPGLAQHDLAQRRRQHRDRPERRAARLPRRPQQHLRGRGPGVHPRLPLAARPARRRRRQRLRAPPAGRPDAIIYKAGWQEQSRISTGRPTANSSAGRRMGCRLDPGLIDPGGRRPRLRRDRPGRRGGSSSDGPFGSQLGARGLPPAPPRGRRFR